LGFAPNFALSKALDRGIGCLLGGNDVKHPRLNLAELSGEPEEPQADRPTDK
jgi:hypothetical protein